MNARTSVGLQNGPGRTGCVPSLPTGSLAHGPYLCHSQFGSIWRGFFTLSSGDTPHRATMHIGTLFLALMAVVLFAGCQSDGSVNTVERAEPVGRRQLLVDKRVITDKSLADKLGVVAVNQSISPGGLLLVQLEVANRSSSYQRFNYRFEWFDPNGMLVNTPASTWVTEQIEGGETKFISGLAPTPSCQDFRVKFIKPAN